MKQQKERRERWMKKELNEEEWKNWVKKNKIEMKMNEIRKRNVKTYKVRKTEWNKKKSRH